MYRLAYSQMHTVFTRTFGWSEKTAPMGDPSRRVGDVWEMRSRPVETTPARAGVQCGGLYLFSGLLNEVTQVVLLNTFPISIMNHLLLIIPVQPRGARFHTAWWAVCTCACAPLSMRALVHDICPKRRTRGWIQLMWQTESRLFNEKVDERWHSLATFHTPPPYSQQHSDFHLDEPSRVVTVTTGNNVLISTKKNL